MNIAQLGMLLMSPGIELQSRALPLPTTCDAPLCRNGGSARMGLWILLVRKQTGEDT
jgi:hypothetical protein